MEAELFNNSGAVVYNSFRADEKSFADLIGGKLSATRVMTSCSRGVRASYAVGRLSRTNRDVFKIQNNSQYDFIFNI